MKDITHPGGNITGVINLDSTPKVMEYLKLIKPGLKKVYLPYNPDDEVSVVSISGLDKIVSQIGIEVVYQKVRSVEETVAAIAALPEDVDAVFRIPSPTLDPKNSDLSRAAIKRGLPMAARLPLDNDVLITYASFFRQRPLFDELHGSILYFEGQL